MTDTEKKIIAGCKRGDADCQKLLYLEYGPLVKGIMLRYTDAETAADLFQDTFVFILTNIHKFREPHNLGGWIRRVAVNCAIDHLRKEHYRQTSCFDDVSDIPDDAPIYDALTAEQLISLINKLPDKYRTAFNLYEVDGYAQAEIARIMGETQTNVRTLISRAKSILRSSIRVFLKNEEYKID